MTRLVHEIDVLTLARAVISGSKPLTEVSRLELVGLCAFVLRVNSEEPEVLDAGDSASEPVLPASIAASVAAFLRAHDEVVANRFESNGLDNMERRRVADEAFNTLKTRFEKEFPDGNQ